MWHKLWTALRGAQNEALERAVDGQSIRILEQELREAGSHLRRATMEMTALMGREIAAERALKEGHERAASQEIMIKRALAADQQQLAEQGAALLGETLQSNDQHRATLANCRGQIARLRQATESTERRLAQMRRELTHAKSIAAVQAAEGALVQGTRSCASALQAAEETLERIKQMQGSGADEIEAARRLAEDKDGTSFTRAMERAGLTDPNPHSPQALLGRLKQELAAAKPTAA